MGNITFNILLEFLYNRFAVTFIFCLIGSCIREALKTTKKDSKSKINIKKIATSTMFSTFLMCACAEYIDLPFGVYAVLSVFGGMWGLVIAELAMNGNFVIKFLGKLTKKVITDPIVKNALESASETIKEEEEKSSKKEDDQ